MRWIWIDRFLEFESGKSAKAVKLTSSAEDHFRDHFPGYPVMPGSLILEGLAQTGGILVGEARNFEEKVVLAKFNFASFTREVLAGELLIFNAEILSLRTEGASVNASASVGEETIVEAEIFFAHLDQNRSKQIFGDRNFVFSGELNRLRGLIESVRKQEDQPTTE